MARKRGGVAGFYDRNKGWLKKAVPAGLSFIPGVGIPLAAAAGAAFGADKEGRNFFNLSNIPGALRGAVEGYGIGKGTQAVAGGVKGLLAPKAPDISGAMSRASGMIGQANQQIAANPAFGGMTAGAGAGGYGGVGSMPGIGFGLGGMQPPVAGGPVTSTDYIGRAVNQSLSQPPATGGGSSFGLGRSAADQAFGSLRMPLGDVANAGVKAGTSNKFVQALLNPQVLSGAVQGGLSMLPDAKSAAMDAQTKLAQQQFDEEKRRFQMEEERKRRIAELLMPYMQQNFPQYLGGR